MAARVAADEEGGRSSTSDAGLAGDSGDDVGGGVAGMLSEAMLRLECRVRWAERGVGVCVRVLRR